MANRPRVEGVDYTPEAVASAREELVEMRNIALDAANFHAAVLLSHIIAYLADYKEVMEELNGH